MGYIELTTAVFRGLKLLFVLVFAALMAAALDPLGLPLRPKGHMCLGAPFGSLHITSLFPDPVVEISRGVGACVYAAPCVRSYSGVQGRSISHRQPFRSPFVPCRYFGLSVGLTGSVTRPYTPPHTRVRCVLRCAQSAPPFICT